MRPIGSKTLAAKDATSLLVYNVSELDFREVMSSMKIKLSELVSHFIPKAFVFG